MAHHRLGYIGLLLFFAVYTSAQSNTIISVGAHSNGVSIGEPVVYNKGKANIGFLNRFKGSSFSAAFYLSNDTLCQDDITQIVLLDSTYLGSKRFTLDFLGGNNNSTIALDSVFNPSDTGWYPFELTVKLGRRRKREQSGFYVLPRPFYSGVDTINICQESNQFFFKPDIEQCSSCIIDFPNSSSGLDSVQLTITKDTLYTFNFQNEQGCSDQQSIWFDYQPTPTITSINSSLTICNEDTINIGYQTNGSINWLSNPYQGSSVSVSPAQTTAYYANALSAVGCISEIDTITVNVNQLPVITLQDSNYVCVGLTEDLVPQIAGNGGYQFSWSSGENTKDITIPDATASYTLTVTDINGCIETHTVNNNLIDYTIDAGVNDSICFGENYDFAPFQGIYSAVYWSIEDSTISSVLNHSVVPLLTTWYTLTTANDSGCVKTDSLKIAVDSLSQLSYSINGLEDLKIGDTLSFNNLNIEPFHDYDWMIDGTLISTQNDSTFWMPVFEGQYTASLVGRNSLLCPISLDSSFIVRDILPRDYERLLYPNPTTGKFSYNFYAEFAQEVTVTIINDGGRTVSSEQRAAKKGMNIYEFDITTAAAGKYYVIIESELGTQNAIRPWVIKL